MTRKKVWLLQSDLSDDGKSNGSRSRTIGYTSNEDLARRHEAWIESNPYRTGGTTLVHEMLDCELDTLHGDQFCAAHARRGKRKAQDGGRG